MTVRFDPNFKLSNLAGIGGDSLFTQAGLDQALLAAIEHIAKGGQPEQALLVGMGVVKSSPFGMAGGQNLKLATAFLDTIIKHPQVAQHWGQLGTWVAKPETQKFIVNGLSKVVGGEAGKILGDFGTRLVKQLAGNKGGFEQAFKFAERAAPVVAKKLGGTKGLGGLLAKLLPKVGKFIPFVGLAIGLINAVKVFTQKPPASPLEKLNALVGVAAGAAAVIPGVGTGVAAALNTASTALGGLEMASNFLPQGTLGSKTADTFDPNARINPDLFKSPEGQVVYDQGTHAGSITPEMRAQIATERNRLASRLKTVQSVDDITALIVDYKDLEIRLKLDLAPEEEVRDVSRIHAELNVLRSVIALPERAFADGAVTDAELTKLVDRIRSKHDNWRTSLSPQSNELYDGVVKNFENLQGLPEAQRAQVLQVTHQFLMEQLRQL